MGVGRREPLPRVGEIARVVEDYGFSAFFIQDNPLMTKDPYMALTVAALNTSRLRLGPAVSNPLIRHPSVIANSIFTLDHLSEGRAVLGFGSGGPALVIPLGYAPRRIAEFRQDLLQIRTLLCGEEVVGPGSMCFRIPGIERRIPIYVAASGPLMLRTAGELADGVIIAGSAQRDVLSRKIEIVKEGARSAGRDPSEVKVNILVNMAVDADSQRAVDAIRPFVVGAIIEGGAAEIPQQYENVVRMVHAQHDPSRHLAAGAPETALIPDELAKFVTIAGDEAECRDRLASIISLQPDEITFTLMTGGRMERLKSLAKVALGAS
ncbi:MAG: LLM class flavin-dependent oxidoreductase [Anaerolineae bacterium]